MRNQKYASSTKGFEQVIISAEDFPQVLKFISIPRRTIYINAAAQEGAKLVKLSYDDRDLLKI